MTAWRKDKLNVPLKHIAIDMKLKIISDEKLTCVYNYTRGCEGSKPHNPSKCKELRIDFLQYKPSGLPPLQMSGSIIEQVPSYKLLGVHLSHNLSWSIHCDYIVKRARKRLYILRVLMKSGLPPADLIQVELV